MGSSQPVYTPAYVHVSLAMQVHQRLVPPYQEQPSHPGGQWSGQDCPGGGSSTAHSGRRCASSTDWCCSHCPGHGSAYGRWALPVHAPSSKHTCMMSCRCLCLGPFLTSRCTRRSPASPKMVLMKPCSTCLCVFIHNVVVCGWLTNNGLCSRAFAVALLVGAMFPGEFEQRMSSVLTELTQAGQQAAASAVGQVGRHHLAGSKELHSSWLA